MKECYTIEMLNNGIATIKNDNHNSKSFDHNYLREKYYVKVLDENGEEYGIRYFL